MLELKLLEYPSTRFMSFKWHNRSSSLPNFPIVPNRLQRIVSSSSLQAFKSCDNVVVSSTPLTALRNRGKGMNWFHEMELVVRGYEVDQYDVVNNAVYADYCQYGKFELHDKIGWEADKLAIKELSLNFIAPLRRRDKFVLKVRICDLYGARIRLEILIFKLPNLEPILEAKSTVVWLNKNHRPTPIPPDMISKYNQFLLQGMDAKFQENGYGN